jgi:hypothetical protein
VFHNDVNEEMKNTEMTEYCHARWFVLLGILCLGARAQAAVYEWSIAQEEGRRDYLWIPESCQWIRGPVVGMNKLTESGLAEVAGNRPRFTAIPPRSKLPTRVIVTAYQMGRVPQPQMQSAAPVEQSFFILGAAKDTKSPSQDLSALPDAPAGATRCSGFGVDTNSERVLQLKPILHRPCLLIDPQDIPEVKRRLEAMPDRPKADLRHMDYALYALLYGDAECKRRTTAEFMARVRKVLKPGNGKDLASDRRFNELLYSYDVIASFGCLSAEEEREFKDGAIRAARFILGDDPAKFRSPRTPSSNGMEFPEGFSTCNRWTDQFLGPVLVGLNFPDHPMAKPWVQYAIGQIRYQLDHGNWDGAWNEVPRYHNWQILLYSGLFQALQRRAGVNFFQDPGTRQLLDWYVRFSSSLVRFPETTQRNPAGEPTLPVWGDSNYGPMFQACAMYASHYATSDPAFSKRLMWMWRRAGSPFQHGWHFDLIFPMLADPSLSDEPQTLSSAFCRKMGYVLLRSGFDTPDETVVYLRGGQRGITHPRSDLGSIDLFSQGMPLALGSQSGPYVGQEIEWNRSQQSNNEVVFGGKSRDRRESSGTVDAFSTGPQVDYAVADCSRPVTRFVKKEDSFRWRRHLVLVKRPDYLVVWDEIASPMPSAWFLHTTARRCSWDKNRITCRTDYNADLDVHVLSPGRPLVPNEREGPFGSWLYDDPKRGKEDPYPFMKLKYFSISARPDEHFVMVLHPRKPDAAALQATLMSSNKNGCELHIVHANHIDAIKLTGDGGSFQRSGSPAVLLPMRVVSNTEPGVEPSAAAEVNQLTAAEDAAGCSLPFDGMSTRDWREVTGAPLPVVSWTVEDARRRLTTPSSVALVSHQARRFSRIPPNDPLMTPSQTSQVLNR